MGGSYNYPYKKEQIVVYGASVTMSREHWKLYCGCNSVSNHYFADVDDDDFVYVLLKVGLLAYLDTNIEITAMGKCIVNFYKNPFIDDDGTEVLVTNPHQGSERAQVGTLDICHTPTIGSGGNGEVIYPNKLIYGKEGSMPFTLGMKNGLNGLWKLNKDTEYLIAVQNKSGATNDFAIEIAATREAY